MFARAAWKDLSRNQREALWQALAGRDAKQAFEAMAVLATAPEQAAVFLRDHLAALAPPEPKRLARLLKELDDEDFAVREEAERQLKHIGDEAEDVLRKARAETDSTEVRARLDRVLDRLKGPRTGSRLRILRAVEVLERIGGEVGRDTLRTLKREARWSLVKREVGDALERLTRKRLNSSDP
jgi:hypothetical protein